MRTTSEATLKTKMISDSRAILVKWICSMQSRTPKEMNPGDSERWRRRKREICLSGKPKRQTWSKRDRNSSLSRGLWTRISSVQFASTCSSNHSVLSVVTRKIFIIILIRFCQLCIFKYFLNYTKTCPLCRRQVEQNIEVLKTNNQFRILPSMSFWTL